MTAANYDASLARLLVHEGGYSNHPSDPGGPTNYGITIHDYRKYIDRNGTAADVRAMTVEQAKLIYRRRYWDVQRCDQLPAGVDYAIFDYGVNSGIGRSGKVLRRVLGLSDGTSAISDEVIAAAGRRDPKVLASAICDERLAFLRGLGTWPTFGRGWGRRVAEVRAAALAMAGASQGVITQPEPAPAQAGAPGAIPPWLARMNAILGLYEFQGGADNPAIIAMAKACGGSIAREYRHDSIPWCALTVNYVLIASGLPGNDSLWALDFAKYGKRLSGPAVGCIASQKRSWGRACLPGGRPNLGWHDRWPGRQPVGHGVRYDVFGRRQHPGLYVAGRISGSDQSDIRGPADRPTSSQGAQGYRPSATHQARRARQGRGARAEGDKADCNRCRRRKRGGRGDVVGLGADACARDRADRGGRGPDGRRGGPCGAPALQGETGSAHAGAGPGLRPTRGFDGRAGGGRTMIHAAVVMLVVAAVIGALIDAGRRPGTPRRAKAQVPTLIALGFSALFFAAALLGF